jgi:hypothetical protein
MFPITPLLPFILQNILSRTAFLHKKYIILFTAFYCWLSLAVNGMIQVCFQFCGSGIWLEGWVAYLFMFVVHLNTIVLSPLIMWSEQLFK